MNGSTLKLMMLKPDVVKHFKIDFDWSVRNRREDPLLPLHLNFLNSIFILNDLKLNN